MSQTKIDPAASEARLVRARADLLRVALLRAPRATVEAAARRYHEAREDLRKALGRPEPGEPAPELPPSLTGHLFAAPGAAADLRAGAGAAPRVAVCFSGGGTRAASCSMGALRALRELGLLEKVHALSTVSGGGWAGALYEYAPYSDDELLGPFVPDAEIGKLTWSSGPAPFNQSLLGPHAIGTFCTRLGWDALVQGTINLWLVYGSTLSPHAYWPRLIGQYVLEPYGLGDHRDSKGAPTRYYTADPSWFEVAVKKFNPALAPGSFYFGKPNRPFWAASSTFNAPGEDPVPYPFWLTQLDAGIYPPFPRQGIGGADLGGGSIDPFTFGSARPTRFGEGLFTVATPKAQFALSDAAGTSSAAFGVELFARLPDWLEEIIGDLTPEYAYWPAMSPSQPAQTYQLSDGAGLDNSALCGLLGWSGATSILSFIHTDVPIVIDANLPVTDIDGVQMDSSIPPLFGWVWDSDLRGYRAVSPADGTAQFLQVFPSGSFGDLIRGLRSSIGGGGAAVSKITTETVANSHFGVAGGRSVEVLFFFNHRAPRFWNQLDWEIHWGLELDYPLVTFPYFDTVRDLNLNPRAVNLLANLTSWSVTTNRALVSSMFAR